MRLMRHGEHAGRTLDGGRALEAQLDGLSGAGVISLHRRLGPGTREIIDHLAVTPTGVWVIDARLCSGRAVTRDAGHWVSTDVHLRVGGRDRMKLVRAMSRQVDAVRRTLGPAWDDVPVRSMLCFVDAESRWFAKPFELRGVLVTWPSAAGDVLTRLGPYQAASVARMAATLDEGLPPRS